MSKDSGSIVPDGVVRSQTDPLGNWAILLLSFGKLLLGSEGLVALHFVRLDISPQTQQEVAYRHRDG